MKTRTDSFKKRVPIVQIDPSLDKYDKVVLFPEKLAKANEMLHSVGLPQYPKKNHKAKIILKERFSYLFSIIAESLVTITSLDCEF